MFRATKADHPCPHRYARPALFTFFEKRWNAASAIASLTRRENDQASGIRQDFYLQQESRSEPVSHREAAQSLASDRVSA
jgi:hypothetical protein